MRKEARERMARNRLTPEGRAASNEAAARYRRRCGRPTIEQRRKLPYLPGGSVFEKAQDSLAVRNALQAFRYWVKVKASDQAVANWYWALGRPWANPRLSDADQYATRYSCDPAFRMQEINRQTHRKETLLERDDGTIDYAALLKERKSCPYCAVRLTRENTVLDHMEPISRNGENSANNLTVCCRDCNGKKGGKLFIEWLECLPPRRRGAAGRWYQRKRRHRPGNLLLPLLFMEK